MVHADYAQQGAPIRVSLFSDRIEIENPGVLLAGLTIDDIRQGISWLPVIRQLRRGLAVKLNS